MSGQTLILLPGLLCDETVWTAQQAALRGTARILSPVFYGADSIEAMAERVLAIAPERFALAGHSMGGRVAFHVVRTAPERVTRLAVFDTGIRPRGPGEVEKRQRLVDLAFAEGMGALADQWLPPMVHPDRRRQAAFMDALRAMVRRATPEIFAGQIKALLNRPDPTPILGRISCPTLVGCGRQDEWSPLADHEEIAAAIPGAELRIFETCGHMASVEVPEAVTAALNQWLGR